MRVLLINDYATPTGGAEHIVLALRQELRRRGHDVRLFSSSARPLGMSSRADEHCFGTLSPFRGLTQIWNPSAYSTLRRLLHDFQPDVVHVRLFLSQISPAILPLLHAVPTLYHVAWYRCICPIGTKMLPDGRDCSNSPGFNCLESGCIPAYALPSVLLQRHFFTHGRSAFNAIVTNSQCTRAKLEAEGIPVDGVLWNGVAPREPRVRLAPVPTIAFAGRLVREKGTDLLIHALQRIHKRLPDARLLLAGDGPERKALVELARSLHLDQHVTFLGHLAPEAMEQHFREAWVQAVPSRWQEPFGIVAAEALMRGTPVVASDAGGLAEFVHHGQTGLLCQRNEVAPLADALLTLLTDQEMNLRMGENARNFALQHLTFSSMADRVLDTYDTIRQDRASHAAAISSTQAAL